MDIRRKYVGIARRVRTSSRPRDPAEGVQNLVALEGGLQPDAAFFSRQDAGHPSPSCPPRTSL